MKITKAFAAAFAVIIGFATVVGTPVAANAATQRADFSINGACYDNSDTYGEFALYEQDEDDCWFSVQVSKPKVKRKVSLQYYDNTTRKWIEEDRSTTDPTGYAEVYVEPWSCGDFGYDFCDGGWTYRVVLLKKGTYKQKKSPTADLWFYPIPV